eukprot:scaffold3427_cov222-Pinguiococcus_pyrenoidosus.AAC.3
MKRSEASMPARSTLKAEVRRQAARIRRTRQCGDGGLGEADQRLRTAFGSSPGASKEAGSS